MRIAITFSTRLRIEIRSVKAPFCAFNRRFCPLIAGVCHHAAIVIKLKLLFQLYAITCNPKSRAFRLMPRYRVLPQPVFFIHANGCSTTARIPDTRRLCHFCVGVNSFWPRTRFSIMPQKTPRSSSAALRFLSIYALSAQTPCFSFSTNSSMWLLSCAFAVSYR